MLDQSFSAENFRKIFDAENRRGIYLESDFFPDVAIVTSDLKRIKHEFKKLKKKKKTLSVEDYDRDKTVLNIRKEELKETKERLLSAALEKVSKEVSGDVFLFPLKTIIDKFEKSVYYFEYEPKSYFVSKQVQSNIRKLYQVKQGNRNEIVAQLEKVLGDTFPKVIVRTDIKGFYENISRDILIKKLNKDPLLTLSSKKFIWKALQSYKDLSGSDKGVPRGLGISAYLSELYLKSFDEAIKSHRDLLYYARYVDDVVAVFVPSTSIEPADYLDFLKEKADALELNLHPAGSGKTKVEDLRSPKNVTMEYLGYKFSYGTGEVVVGIGSKKHARYRMRVEKSFDQYSKSSRTNEKKARKLLIKRIRFLTGNTRLLNNKRNALVGVYFSNSMANELSVLQGLDLYLAHKIDGAFPAGLKARISSMSFVDGFKSRRFCQYTAKDLKLIVAAWKND